MRTLGEVAESLGLEVRGDRSLMLSAIAPLSVAQPSELSFIAHAKYLGDIAGASPGALILKAEWVDHWKGPCLITQDPYLCYAQATHLFDTRPPIPDGVHQSAVVHESAVIGAEVRVGPNAVIGADVILDDGVCVGAGVCIEARVRVGANTMLCPGVVLYHDVVVGNDCVVHANSVVGSDGFGYAPADGRWEKILQLGTVCIGDRTEIGASVTIDRGALHDTVIGDDVIIDNQVHLAHGVQVGDGSAIAACVAVAGSTKIGKRCQFAGQAGVADHIELADDVHIGGQGRVSGSIAEPGHYVSGTPIQAFADWRRSAVRFTQLEQMHQKLRGLEKTVALLSAEKKNSEDSDS